MIIGLGMFSYVKYVFIFLVKVWLVQVTSHVCVSGYIFCSIVGVVFDLKNGPQVFPIPSQIRLILYVSKIPASM